MKNLKIADNFLIKKISKNKNLVMGSIIQEIFKYRYIYNINVFNKNNNNYRLNLLIKINMFSNFHFRNNFKFKNYKAALSDFFTNIFNDINTFVNNKAHKDNQNKIFFKNAL